MATWEDVRRIALALPQTEERTSGDGLLQWRIRDKLIAWERPLRRSDFEALGDRAPQGLILGARVPDLGAKEALLALENASPSELDELLTEAWLCRAPKRLVADYLRRPSA